MSLEIMESGPVWVCRATDTRLDGALADAFQRAVAQASDNVPVRFVLDLEPVEYVDSTALSAMVSVTRAMQPDRLQLCSVHPVVMDILRLTQLDTFFDIHADVESARSAVVPA